MLDLTPSKQINGILLPFLEDSVLQEFRTSTATMGTQNIAPPDHPMGTHMWRRKRYLDFRPVGLEIGKRAKDRSTGLEISKPLKELPLSVRECTETMKYIAVPEKDRPGFYQVVLKVVTTLSPESGLYFPKGKDRHVLRLLQKTPSGKKRFSRLEALEFLRRVETQEGLTGFSDAERIQMEYMHWSKFIVAPVKNSPVEAQPQSEILPEAEPVIHRSAKSISKGTLSLSKPLRKKTMRFIERRRRAASTPELCV